MSHMHFHRIDARLQSPLGSIAIPTHQLIHLLGGNLFRDIAPARCGNGRGRLQRSAGIFRVPLRAGILQLNRHLCPIRMARFGNSPQTGNGIIAV